MFGCYGFPIYWFGDWNRSVYQGYILRRLPRCLHKLIRQWFQGGSSADNLTLVFCCFSSTEMRRDDISREELFALVWERPATEVAQELGISDVALGKLCHRLQVPKPPRGYWARVRAGRTQKRPPLAAFREEIEKERKAQLRGSVVARLSPIQRQFVSCALSELKQKGIDTGGCQLAYDGFRSIGAEIAAQILLLIQNSYRKWMDDGLVPVRYSSGVRHSLAGLVHKLLPLAKEQVIVFRDNRGARYSDERGPVVIVRLTPWLQRRLTGLARLVKQQRLDYIASPLVPHNHAWAVHHLFSADSYVSAKSTLCVSATALWVDCERRSYFDDDRTETFRTDAVNLREIVPVDFLSAKDIALPAVLPRAAIQPFRKRLKALQDAERVFNMLTDSGYEMERAVPDERLALADRLWFGEQGPFLAARKAWQNLQREIDRWEMALDAEKTVLCREILRIEIGDIAVVPSRDQLVRIRVESATVYAGEADVLFVVTGTRFRKDGTLGKRQDSFFLKLEDERSGP